MQKPIRPKDVRREEQRITGVKNLMGMFHLDRNDNQYEYQVIGGSTASATAPMDPRTEKTKALVHMFGLQDRIG